MRQPYCPPSPCRVSNGSIHVNRHMSRGIMGQATEQGWQAYARANVMQLLMLNYGKYTYSEGMWLEAVHLQSLQQLQ